MKLIGVTSAINVLDRGWGNIPAAKRRYYMHWGREFHSYALGWVAMGSLPFDPPEEIAPSFEKFVDWYERTVEETITTECEVEDKELGYRGRLDLAAIIKGDRLATLMDLKRAYAVDRPTGFQLEAYRRPAERKLRRKLRRRLAVLVPRDGPCRAVEFKDDERDWVGFLNCLSLRRILDGG